MHASVGVTGVSRANRVLRLYLSDIICNENSKTTPRALSYWSSIATGRQKLLVVYQTSYPDWPVVSGLSACRA